MLVNAVYQDIPKYDRGWLIRPMQLGLAAGQNRLSEGSAGLSGPVDTT
jgi:hypothetical protein